MIKQSKRRFWSWPRELRQRGILGINARNLHLSELNPRRFYAALDDKMLTKTICEERDIPVPETFLVVGRTDDLRRFSGLVEKQQEFVVKPARGAGGRGVVVVVRHNGKAFETSGGEILSSAEMQYHLLTTRSGLFSLGNRPDRAIVEQRIVPHPVFDGLAMGGTPDIRVVVYRGVPVMAMLRLPTEESAGRANLHQGAVGVGIQLETGLTFGGVHRDRAVSVHPETAASMEGMAIPRWPEVLAMAARLSEAFELLYVGVDIVLDANRGPVVLEANARPGLAIQIANRRGLWSRLEMVEEQAAEVLSPARRRELAAVLSNAS